MTLDDINNFIGDIDLELLDQLLKGNFSQRHTILEIGCGLGRNMIPFLNLKKALYGIDIDLANVEVCRMIARSLGGNPAYIKQSDASMIPAENDFFDAIINCRVMHFATSIKVFKKQWEEQIRVLKKGGLLYMSMDAILQNEDIAVKITEDIAQFNDQSLRLVLTEKLLEQIQLTTHFKLLEPIKTIRFNNEHAHAILVLEKR